jgi:CRISPR/Cas system-associated exonuclease Cas4 (RecB family)
MVEDQRITSWSFSRLEKYKRCPFAAKCSYILKIKEPGSKAMDRGSLIHKLAEDYVSGKLSQLPIELNNFAKEFSKLQTLKPKLELEWAFTSSWEPCDWKDWSRAWLRVKLDVDVVSDERRYVVDHKTGKFRDYHLDQLELYALSAFIIHQDDDIEAQNWYLDDDNETTRIQGADFKRTQVEDLKKKWIEISKPMLSDTRFAPCPSNDCRFCFFRKNGPNNGPCQY